MLVLRRCLYETVVLTIPPSAEVRTVEVILVDGEACRLGFEAPKDIRIARKELTQDKPAQDVA